MDRRRNEIEADMVTKKIMEIVYFIMESYRERKFTQAEIVEKVKEKYELILNIQDVGNLLRENNYSHTKDHGGPGQRGMYVIPPLFREKLKKMISGK